MRITGQIAQGHGVASGQSGDMRYPGGTLQAQFHYFKERGLDLSPYYPGTINLDISPYEFRIGRPKLFLKGINWSEFIPPENFYFFDVEVFRGQEIFQGLIYMPDPATKVEHEQEAAILELLLPKITDLQYGDQLEIVVPAEQLAFIVR